MGLGDSYDKLNRYEEAIEAYHRGCKLSDYKDSFAIADLAGAYAESGYFDKAIEYQKTAIELADDETKVEYAKRLAAYKAHKPWRE